MGSIPWLGLLLLAIAARASGNAYQVLDAASKTSAGARFVRAAEEQPADTDVSVESVEEDDESDEDEDEDDDEDDSEVLSEQWSKYLDFIQGSHYCTRSGYYPRTDLDLDDRSVKRDCNDLESSLGGIEDERSASFRVLQSAYDFHCCERRARRAPPPNDCAPQAARPKANNSRARGGGGLQRPKPPRGRDRPTMAGRTGGGGGSASGQRNFGAKRKRTKPKEGEEKRPDQGFLDQGRPAGPGPGK